MTAGCLCSRVSRCCRLLSSTSITVCCGDLSSYIRMIAPLPLTVTLRWCPCPSPEALFPCLQSERDSKEEIAKVFALFDPDGNGRIGFRDLKRVIMELGESRIHNK